MALRPERFRYVIDRPRRVCHVTWLVPGLGEAASGEGAGKAPKTEPDPRLVNPAELAAGMETLWADPAFDRRFAVLADMRAVRMNHTYEAGRGLAQAQAAKMPDRGPLAIIVGDDLSFGTCSQFATLAGFRGWIVAVFRDLAAAEAWITEHMKITRTHETASGGGDRPEGSR